jgi:hypothetical protein
MGADMNIGTLLDRLDKVRRTGPNKWLACCPAHEDKSPSLGVRLTDDGKILIHCFGGCSVSEIVGAVGLTLADLMPERPQGYDRTRAKVPRFSKSEMFDLLHHSSIILSLAIRQLMSGNPLSANDLISVTRAEQLIDSINKEVRP